MTNPPAFPHGMSLRSYFAGQALSGILSDNEYKQKCITVVEGSLNTLSYAKMVAMDAFEIADAMMEESQKIK